jgi:hypothetical protein
MPKRDKKKKDSTEVMPKGNKKDKNPIFAVFKEKYKNDPEFKAKHQAYMRERIKCVCGYTVTRNYMSQHKKMMRHRNYVEQLQASVVTLDLSEKQESSEEQEYGYIYLIREREFLLRNEEVYKMGCTIQKTASLQLDRFKKYKKGSQLVYTRTCNADSIFKIESEIKDEFRKQFKSHSDGHEYFMGDSCKMINLMNSCMESYSSD